MEVRGKGDFFFHIFSNYNAQIRNDFAIGIHKKTKDQLFQNILNDLQ